MRRGTKASRKKEKTVAVINERERERDGKRKIVWLFLTNGVKV